MKTCKTCNIPKDITEFRGNLNSCKKCNNRKNTLMKQQSVQ